MRPRDFKRMTLRTHVISTMRFDGHLSDGYPSTYGHMYSGLISVASSYKQLHVLKRIHFFCNLDIHVSETLK